MAESINEYGDVFCPTNDGCGVDIASQRQDELDFQSLSYIRSRSGQYLTALDLGGGFGAHSVRMAQAGAYVTMVDISDMASENFKKYVVDGTVKKENLTFIKKDFISLVASDIPHELSLLYSQRAIHYVPYIQAKQLLSLIFNHMVEGGMVFISAAGFDTEYGKTYPDRREALDDRFNFVSPDMQVKHGIEHKIVTYREDDMARLIKESGFSPTSINVSTFGNIKAIAQKL